MAHYDDDTLALIALGEPAAAPDGGAHLAGCEACRDEVAALAAVVATARSTTPADRPVAPPPQVWDRIAAEIAADATAGAPVVELAAQPEPRKATKGRSRWLPLAAAAAVGAILGCGGTYALTHGSGTAPPDPGAPIAVAPLQPLDDPAASGTAVVRASSPADRSVDVRVSGLPPKPGTFYEVWLMDPRTSRLVALGVLDAQGEGVFSVPAGLDLSAYSAVDVSLQPMNGSPLHSGDSPVRGELGA